VAVLLLLMAQIAAVLETTPYLAPLHPLVVAAVVGLRL
jgi:hypothetical protein